MSRRYFLRKIGQALFSLWFVLTLNFILIQIAPGTPIDRYVRNQKLTKPEQALLLHDMGLDKPVWQQYLVYMDNTIHGDMGLSFISGQPVSEVIAAHVGPTLLLVGIATVFSTIFGVMIGITTAWNRGSRKDMGLSAFSMAFYAMPDFWLGMMFLIIFAAGLGWFPVAGFKTAGADYTGVQNVLDIAWHMFLPCLTLTLGYLAEYALIMRSSLVDVMGEDFITIARAKGMRDRAVRRRHAVPNALLPTITVIILYFGYVLSGAIGVEYVFSYPGLGLLTAQAIGAQDYPLQSGLLLILAVVVIIAKMVTDILYGYLDPRVKEG